MDGNVLPVLPVCEARIGWIALADGAEREMEENRLAPRVHIHEQPRSETDFNTLLRFTMRIPTERSQRAIDTEERDIASFIYSVTMNSRRFTKANEDSTENG
jgi:hypothetical protein